MQTPSRCPKCGHQPVAKILWGMPAFSPELERELREGRVCLGGCTVTGNDPKWRCTACGWEGFDPQQQAAWEAFQRLMGRAE